MISYNLSEIGWKVYVDGTFIAGSSPLEHKNYSLGVLQYNKFIEGLKPVRIIYNDPVTVCFFPDGSKEVVRCNPNEPFEPEYGVMAAIMRKIFNSRSEFLKLVDSGYYQEEK